MKVFYDLSINSQKAYVGKFALMRALAIVIVGLLLTFTACNLYFPSKSNVYERTLEARTDGQARHPSRVVEKTQLKMVGAGNDVIATLNAEIAPQYVEQNCLIRRSIANAGEGNDVVFALGGDDADFYAVAYTLSDGVTSMPIARKG